MPYRLYLTIYLLFCYNVNINHRRVKNLFTHTCVICQNTFESTSNRAKYCCDYCRDKAQVLRNKAYKEKKLLGTSVKVGSEQICPYCNNTYTVVTGSQKCCKECQKKRRNTNPPSNPQYVKENYETIRVYVPKGQRDDIKAYAQSQGLSVNKLLITALEEYRKNHE